MNLPNFEAQELMTSINSRLTFINNNSHAIFQGISNQNTPEMIKIKERMFEEVDNVIDKLKSLKIHING